MPYSWTWVVSHCECRPWPHIQQSPQETLKGMTTRSPTASSVTSRSDLLDDPHRLVSEHVAGVEERGQHRVEMKV